MNLILIALTGHGMKLAPSLIGVTAGAQDWIGKRMPLYPLAVRLRNQLEASLFGTSAVPAVVIGRGGELIERSYIEEYCARDIAAFLPGAGAWARRLRQIQDDTERRGQTFLYVVNPSKVGEYPGVIPASWPCLAPVADRVGLVPAWLAIVRRAGIHVVDTTAVLRAADGAYPFRLWPRGGTHWNAVGAALAAQAVAAGLAAQRHDAVFAPFAFTWTMRPVPAAPDDDLATLMNQLWTPGREPMPAVTIVQPVPADCPRLEVAVVGGSFMQRVAETLGRTACAPHVVEYEYWGINRIDWPDHTRRVGPVDPALRMREVLGADVLIYEENEELVARSRHGPALYDALASRPGWSIGAE